MEFRFELDGLLPSEIVCVDNTLIIPGWKSNTRNRLEYQQLYELINIIGEASSFSQSLNRVITTSEKLQNSDHLLYLMKEFEPQNGRTVLVGMLKIGRKKLFLLHPNKTTKEVAPLCVLDFYIHESRQRRGYGKVMFDYMLMHQNVEPGHLAVDKPSDKFLSFLARHYSLVNQVPQINNFVIYTDFFQERPVSKDEELLTQVVRSNRSSRTTSPDGGMRTPPSNQTRRGSNNAQFAGKPSRHREGGMSDILYGSNEWQGPLGRRHNTRQHTSLDWMRGGPNTSGSDRYYSRTPSYNASPLARTPKDASPYHSGAATPNKPPSVGGDDQSNSRGDNEHLTSVGPTPASSPERRGSLTNKGSTNGVNHTHIAQPQTNGATSMINETTHQMGGPDMGEGVLNGGGIRQLSLSDGGDEIDALPPLVEEGKTGSWRDGLARDSAGLIEHMTKAKGTSSGGVLSDAESVHGHLKFHHHALW